MNAFQGTSTQMKGGRSSFSYSYHVGPRGTTTERLKARFWIQVIRKDFSSRKVHRMPFTRACSEMIDQWPTGSQLKPVRDDAHVTDLRNMASRLTGPGPGPAHGTAVTSEVNLVPG